MTLCIVDVAEGSLQGKICNYHGKKYYSFEGIPYAKPPTGMLRFRDPHLPEKWLGVRDATKPGNKCIQIEPFSKKVLGGSEDCLYLNVYTPYLPRKELKKLPVIFFVHGGKLLFGYGDYYRPEYFIENDVILVTINYRLHVLGFLCLHIPEVSGNMALKDTLMALKWVNNNIDCFNGDKHNITAFGESAGGAILASYLTTKMSDGLFNKLIIESATCLTDMFIVEDDPIFKAKCIAAVMGHNSNDVNSIYSFLMGASIEDLLEGLCVVETSRPPSIVASYFLPVVEKRVDGVQGYFDEYPIVTFQENGFKKVPTLIALHSHEGAAFAQIYKKGNNIYENDLRYFIPLSWFVKLYSPDAHRIASKLSDFYFNGESIDETKLSEFVNFISDSMLNRDVITMVDFIAKKNNELFMFTFSYSGAMNTRVMKNIGLKGATHGDLLQYHFYKKSKADIALERDKLILNVVNQAIFNFARHGVPSWSGQSIIWKPYTCGKGYYVDIDVEPQLKQNFRSNAYTVWSSLGAQSKL